mgnify:CR=1 FL=1
MPKIPRIKAKDFFKYLKKFNCSEISVRGSHHKVRNDKNNKISVVAIHTNEIIAPGMFQAILKQLDIDINQFIELINK